MTKEKKLNKAEQMALKAGFKIGERSPKFGTKAHSTKKKAESFMKESSRKYDYPNR